MILDFDLIHEEASVMTTHMLCNLPLKY